jgi:hypothetical protein
MGRFVPSNVATDIIRPTNRPGRAIPSFPFASSGSNHFAHSCPASGDVPWILRIRLAHNPEALWRGVLDKRAHAGLILQYFEKNGFVSISRGSRKGAGAGHQVRNEEGVSSQKAAYVLPPGRLKCGVPHWKVLYRYGRVIQ